VKDSWTSQHGNSQPSDNGTMSLAHERSLASQLRAAVVMAKTTRHVKWIDVAIANIDTYSWATSFVQYE
jgi:hypothetical protein